MVDDFATFRKKVVFSVAKSFFHHCGHNIWCEPPEDNMELAHLLEDYGIGIGGSSYKAQMYSDMNLFNAIDAKADKVNTTAGYKPSSTVAKGYLASLLKIGGPSEFMGRPAELDVFDEYVVLITPIVEGDKTETLTQEQKDSISQKTTEYHQEVNVPIQQSIVTNTPTSPSVAPVIPYTECVVSINPFVAYDDPFPIPVDPVIVVDPDVEIDPDVTGDELFIYKIESQAVVIESDVMKLYTIESMVSGLKGDVLRVGYVSNSVTLNGNTYTARDPPNGVFCIFPDGTGSNLGRLESGKNNIIINTGEAPNGSKYVLMGSYSAAIVVPTGGRLNITTNPSTAEVVILSGSTVIVTSTGPVYDGTIPAGTYDIQVSASGYITTILRDVVIEDAITKSLIVNLTKVSPVGNKVTFNITSSKDGSDVYVNGISIGVKTPTVYSFYTSVRSRLNSYNIKCVFTDSNGDIYSGTQGWGIGQLGDATIDAHILQSKQ